MSSLREECGVFGIWNEPNAAQITYLGLYAIQHRGQESAGIVSLDEGQHSEHKGLGLVSEVFNQEILSHLKGNAALGHVRYSTHGRNSLNNAQPLTAQLQFGPIAIAHNGNITNANELRQKLKAKGAIFAGTNDTEVFLHLLARENKNDLVAALKSCLPQIEGAFSCLLLSQDQLIAFRDPLGFRPLVLGSKRNGNLVLASETCALDLIGATFEREINPGEIFSIRNVNNTVEILSETWTQAKTLARCVFEHVYFARPDSIVFSEPVYKVRQRMGRILAQEQPAEADIIVPVPDSGVPAALGFASESGIAYEMGIVRNHYVGRTFIEPMASTRSFGVRIKLNAQSAVLKQKRVVLVDDSLVRGTTSRQIVNLVRAAGAKEVHLRIAAPPVIAPCYYGVNTPEKKHLIAAQKSLSEICLEVEADSLGYLSEKGMMQALSGQGVGYCNACFTDQYPTPIGGKHSDNIP